MKARPALLHAWCTRAGPFSAPRIETASFQDGASPAERRAYQTPARDSVSKVLKHESNIMRQTPRAANTDVGRQVPHALSRVGNERGATRKLTPSPLSTRAAAAAVARS
jgi:hypothetical protein